MAKRHTMRLGDWESIFGRLEELVLANSGEDEFEEIFKLLIAKLYTEKYPSREHHFIVYPSARSTASNFNALLTTVLTHWPDILHGPPTSKLTDEHLAICIEALQGHELLDTSAEALDGLFEYLINKSSKGNKGQFFTPRHVIDCCVQMADPSPNETIIDPACGSGGFLLHALSYIRAKHPSIDISDYTRKQLWGCDYDSRVLRVAKALMLISGDGHTNLFRINSLLTPLSTTSLFSSEVVHDDTPRLAIEDITRARFRNFSGFDLVLTNPPFAGEVREEHILQSYELPREKRRVERDVLFIERCVRLLRPGGRLVMVLPHNKLGGINWTYVREWLLRHVQIVAVLGLGRHTFLPHTHQKASVLFAIKRTRPALRTDSESILFMISEKDGKDSKGQIVVKPSSEMDDPVWMRADHDLGQAVEQFKQFITASDIHWRTY